MAAAVAIIDAEGLEALTVRRLASELGVAPMTVYSYVRGKEEILDLVVDRVAADIEVPPVEADWRERARALGHGLRAALLAHPDGARLISERPITVRTPIGFSMPVSASSARPASATPKPSPRTSRSATT